MNVVGIIIYAICILLVIDWFFGVRDRVRHGGGWQVPTLVILFLSVVAVVLVPVLKWSPLHLLWMIPASYVVSILVPFFPVSLLQPFRIMMGKIACIGLNPMEVANNRRRNERVLELMDKEKITLQEAKQKMERDGEW